MKKKTIIIIIIIIVVLTFTLDAALSKVLLPIIMKHLLYLLNNYILPGIKGSLTCLLCLFNAIKSHLAFLALSFVGTPERRALFFCTWAIVTVFCFGVRMNPFYVFKMCTKILIVLLVIYMLS
jgi:hypothetical protein